MTVSDLIKALADWSPDTELQIVTPEGAFQIAQVEFEYNEENTLSLFTGGSS